MAPSLDAHARNSTIRRVQSTGDIPREPRPIYKPLEAPLAADDSDQAGQSSFSSASSSSPPNASPNAAQHLPPVTLTPQSTAMPPLVQLQSQLSSGPIIRHVPLPHRSFYRRSLAFLGLGRGASPERRSLMGLMFNLVSGFIQIVAVVTILCLSGTRLKSPTDPELTEWVACSRPLGVWACIWVVRALLACGLTYWGFLRDRKARQHRHTEEGASAGLSTNSNASAPSVTGNTTSTRTQRHASADSSTPGDPAEHPTLPYSRLYSRLTLLSSLLTLSWFLTAHILEYTSINTCRRSSPHIWWLTFGILCLMYLMVLEVVLLGIVVFIVAPILLLFWNIFLICVGRHPLQTSSMIKPEIGKLSKSLVDRIPLVMYIPPPPSGSPHEKIAPPDPAYSYPPKHAAQHTSVTPPTTSRQRFKFIRRFGGKKRKSGTGSSAQPNDDNVPKEPQTWEAHWEQGEYPFVVLEGNRAACAICLMDFEEPKKIGRLISGGPEPTVETTVQDEAEKLVLRDTDVAAEATQSIVEEGRNDSLKLESAGEGAQPLRLLACGHVFHKTCLDPWLTDISGRCPVCQRAVEFPDEKNPRKQRRQN